MSLAASQVYFTPEGELSSEYGTYKAEVVESKNVRRARGRYGSSESFASADDMDVRSTANTKQNPKQQKGKQSKAALDPREKMRQETLAKESATRKRVTQILSKIRRVLGAIEMIALSSPRLVLSHLSQFSSVSTPLLASPVLSGEALDATNILAKCLPMPLCQEARGLASSLYLALNPTTSADASQHPVLLDAVKTIQRSHQDHGRLLAPLYRFLFPILSCIFSANEITPVHDFAVSLLADHVETSGDWPFGASAKAIFNMWKLVPSHRGTLKSSFESICENFTEKADLVAICEGIFESDIQIRYLACHSLCLSPLLQRSAVPASEDVTFPFWMALHDVDGSVQQAAQQLWKLYGHNLPEDFGLGLRDYLNLPHMSSVKAACASLRDGIMIHPKMCKPVIDMLMETFTSDSFTAQGRFGIGLALKECGPQLRYEAIGFLLNFLVKSGFADEEEKVRESMINAGVAMIDQYGQEHGQDLLDYFEKCMKSSAAALGLASEAVNDLVKQGLVIMLGALACHFGKEDENVDLILEQLINALNTPSEIVQRSVSERLPPLIKMLSSKKDEMGTLVARLLAKLKEEDSFGKRKGAAFGLAGTVKGLGISALKNYGIIETLKNYIEDKKDQNAREGALLAFECLCERLGRLFEPYILHILPLLLVAYGDGTVAVREAAQTSASVIMSKLSTQGMRLVLPALLKGLDEVAWRTKQGSVQLLGAMSSCAPKQLSACLPTIVPKIGSVLKDPHPRVQEAGKSALKQIGSVIKNPEIAQIALPLLNALVDAGKHTKGALEVLLTTKFINTIDAASLSLIVPILNSGLREKGTSNKKKAAQIVGSLFHLVSDPKDMLAYADEIGLNLKKVLIDPIPEARFAAAKALGSLIQGIGPESMRDLLPWLLETLRSDSSNTVEKNGAAQGLSEVLAVLGRKNLDDLMPDILAGCEEDNDNGIREGYLTMFKFLPFCMELSFQRYLEEVMPIVINALSDDAEGVREASLNAAKAIVQVYAENSLYLILPAVESGALSQSWRVRESSIDLLGQLMFKLAGKTSQMNAGSDEGEIYAFTEHQLSTVQDILGASQYQKVLSLIYLLRSDTSYPVRNAAMQMWKVLVFNTPRTVIQILKPLMDLVIDGISERAGDHRQTASSCLGELVTKLGEKITSHVLPIMEQKLKDDSSAIRRGVCYGLSSILQSMSRQQVISYIPRLLPIIQTSMCDDDDSVRAASGDLMTTLFKSAGDVIQEKVLPELLRDINDDTPTSQRSVEGLSVMLRVRPAILHTVLTKLDFATMTAFKGSVLGVIVQAVPPEAVHKNLRKFVHPLLAALNDDTNDVVDEAALHAAECVVGCIDDDGLYELISILCREFDDPASCMASARVIRTTCKLAPGEMQQHVPQLITTIVSVFANAEGRCLLECWGALSEVVKTVPKAALSSHVRTLKDAVQSAIDREKRKRLGGEVLVAGFCEPPKALSAVLPIYLQGLLQSSDAETREIAAEGLGELVAVTAIKTLKPSLAQIAGPLIRILGDRHQWEVKLAILCTLGVLLDKATTFLKPFVPQLQATFLKSLQDGTSEVRLQAAANLGRASQMAMRPDQIVKDLVNTARSSEGGIKEAAVTALGCVLGREAVRAKVSPGLVDDAVAVMREVVANEDEPTDVQSAAKEALACMQGKA